MDKSKSTTKLEIIYDYIEKSIILQSIRNGLVMLIPILFIGSFSVILISLPIDVYQKFITSFLNGVIAKIFSFINNATMGFLSVYLTTAISICYAGEVQAHKNFNYGSVFTSVICFCIFSGILQENFELSALGTQGVFTAIISALGASALYFAFEKRRVKGFRLYTDGADEEFNSAVSMVLPIALVVTIFAIINVIFVEVFDVTGFQMFFSKTMNQLFDNMGRSLKSMLLFAVLVNVMWIFGIHGSNVLEPVSQEFFVPAIEINNKLIESGVEPTEIFSKTFYDCFVLMGGSGTTLCLVLALLIFGKRRSNKNLAKAAAIPMLFNVNEIIVFGLPIVFNPIMVIPFIMVPVVLILISTFAMQTGLVPIPTTQVEWTTPAILSGYLSTGSIAGSVLQVINIIIGALIYAPFVRMYEKEKERDAKKRMDNLIDIVKQSEVGDKSIELLALKNSEGAVAKSIAGDLNYRLSKELPVLYYQPQFDNKNKCIGVEALLRFNSYTYGMLYPPLVVKLAEEMDILAEMEESVFCSVINDVDGLKKILGEDTKISVNVTGVTIQTEKFEMFLKDLKDKYPQYCKSICIEITEQATLRLDDELVERLTRIHNMGYELAIDDFSMGSTSIKYLQTSVFDLVKLDGALSRDVLDNPRSRKIISSITSLTKNFGIQVLAEYVENEEQRKTLEDIGCYYYQGYLYSAAVPVEKLADRIKQIHK